MKKPVLLSMATITLYASSIDEAYVAGKANGQIRTAYVSQNNMVDSDTYGTSIGGIFKYETADWHGLKAVAAAYLSQKLSFASGEGENTNKDFFDKDGQSYLYAGEAYFDYTIGRLNVRAGRQLLDTPLADTDDIRMHPNTFEALIATYSGFDKTTLSGGYLTRWAGYDAPQGHNGSINQFQKFGSNHQSNGAAIVGVQNESIENLVIQGWYYNIDKVSTAFYTDAAYTTYFNESMGVDFLAQYAHFSEKESSRMNGNVYGMAASFNIGPCIFGVAYNKSFNDMGDSVSNGFGGGPYFTSMEEWTIDGMENAEAYRINVQLDMSETLIDGLSLSAFYGDFKSNSTDQHIKEIDIIAAYPINKTLSAELSYAIIADKNKNCSTDALDNPYEGSYNRFLVRLDYNF